MQMLFVCLQCRRACSRQLQMDTTAPCLPFWPAGCCQGKNGSLVKLSQKSVKSDLKEMCKFEIVYLTFKTQQTVLAAVYTHLYTRW